MTIDTGEAAIRNLIAEAIIDHGETAGVRGFDALFAMREAEAIVHALDVAGYQIVRRQA